MTQTCHPSTQEVEVEGSEVEDCPRLHCKFKAEWSLEVTREKQTSEADGDSVYLASASNSKSEDPGGKEDVGSGCWFEECKFYEASLGTLI